eukprot:TRINITY_DN14425_c0_g1_i2.p1 TRINITY_DN14425_c0_g1~~TRINITY_DN14425_c0_g1_i2.p1  ORF type:complete len:444 (+),score=34.00 TRINITY_DN14425_c0_g1_i2:59-1390(+)
MSFNQSFKEMVLHSRQHTIDLESASESYMWGGDEEHRMVEAALVRLVANAHYDVTRYPGQVARMANGQHTEKLKARRQYLGREMYEHSHSAVNWTIRLVVAIAFTAAIPIVAFLSKVPSKCVFQDMLAIHEREYHMRREEQQLYFICEVKERFPFVILAVGTSACWLGPAVWVFVSIVYGFSLSCTRRAYSWHVWLVLNLFRYRPRQVKAIQMNFVEKPIAHEIKGNPLRLTLHVLSRLFYLPYLVGVWFATLVVMFLIVSFYIGEFTWGAVMLLTLLNAYFPAMDLILGADTRLVNLITSDLRRCKLPLPEDLMKTEGMANIVEELAVSDVWWRLFNEQKAMFCCTLHEFELILRYFKESHEGYHSAVRTTRKRWPIWWHDELLLSGNNYIKEVFISDEGTTLYHSSSPHPRSIPANAAKAFSKWYNEIQAMYDSKVHLFDE